MRKGIIAAVIIFIALGLYVFLVEKKRPFTEGKEVVLAFDKDEAQHLLINHNEKEIALNKDKDGEWQITSPLVTKADDGVVKELVNGLSSLSASQALVEVAPSEWQAFGLKKPGCEVTVLIGNHEERVSFGDKNPAGTSVYARMRGRDKIFLVSTYLADSFKKDLFDLREKRVLLFDKEKAVSVELVYNGEDIVLEKQGEEWQLVKPVKDKGDRYEIDAFISSLHDLKAVGFIDEVKEYNPYGLDEPELKCIIGVGSEKIAQTLICGKAFKEGEKDLRYAQRELLSTIFKVEQAKINNLQKTVFDLRNKIILSLERNKIEKIELIYPDRNLVLEKDKAEEESARWFLAGKERVELDSDKVNDLLWDITDIMAKDIVVEEIKDPSLYGLAKPGVKVVVKTKEKENTVLLGKKASGKEDAIYASLIGDPRLFLVSGDLSSRLTKDLTNLKKIEKEEKEENE